MNWYYAKEGQQMGPIPEEELDRLTREGALPPNTLVWREGMANWELLARVRPAPASTLGAAPEALPASDGARCANCGQSFPPDNLVPIQGASICPSCKPTVLQRLRESGSAIESATDPEMLLRRITEENRRIEVSGVFSRAWEVLKANFWPTIGVGLLVLLVLMAGGAVPFIGFCISLIITGPMLGGWYLFNLKNVRGEDGTAGDAFSGFQNNFVQLMLAGLVTGILVYLPLLPFSIAVGFKAWMAQGGEPDIGVLEVVLLILGMLGTMYLALIWTFTVPLVMDKKLMFWKAMETSRRALTMRLGGFILLMLAGMLVSVLGLLALCVGLFVAFPFLFLALAIAYEDLFGERVWGAAPVTTHG